MEEQILKFNFVDPKGQVKWTNPSYEISAQMWEEVENDMVGRSNLTMLAYLNQNINNYKLYILLFIHLFHS